MVSTRKVVLLTAGLIAVQCILAGTALAANLAWEVPAIMSELITALATAVIALAVVIVGLIRILVTRYRQQRHESDKGTMWDALVDALDGDTELVKSLKLMPKVLDLLEEHEKQLKPVVEDYMLRRAKYGEDRRPWDV